MAKKKQRIIINLTCSECKHRNYTTTKNKDQQDPLKLRKHCPWCQKHTLHEQEGIKKKRSKKKK
ncbi:50S ribosomal protein L33 [Patescibacteria group bacterium]|nr:50S ribosomal protein L33 [Patescibacteria group bacterium]